MQKETYELTKEELINAEFIPSIYDNYKDEEERNKVLQEVLKLAENYGVEGVVKRNITKVNSDKKEPDINVLSVLIVNQKGEAEPSIKNYVNIMEKDKNISNLFYYDEFSRETKCLRNGQIKTWNDEDDAILRGYIEDNYGIFNIQKYYDAFCTVKMRRKKHPIKEIIEKDEWDGKPRIDRFLVDIMGCDDDDYSREVSRMIFYGGINRLYFPGCKFDYMPIFIGKQAAGKSTIISWLALDNRFYKDLISVEGKDGMEALDNAWICEMGELLAMVRAKDMEILKAYISRTNDKYRKSYARNPSDNPRHSIFIGSTNDITFLMDKTGNRRYLPIMVKSNARELYKCQTKIKRYILECWREALSLLRQNKAYLVIPIEYDEIVKKHQKDAVMDDPRIGLILSYLSDRQVGEKVSALELFTKCLNGLRKNYNLHEGKEIARVMDMLNDWDRCDQYRDKDFGIQRGWVKIEVRNEIEKTITIFDDEDYDDLD